MFMIMFINNLGPQGGVYRYTIKTQYYNYDYDK